MIFDYNVIWEAMPLYIGGLLTTLKLLALSLALPEDYFDATSASPMLSLRMLRLKHLKK